MNDRFAFKPLVVVRDPVTNRITKVEISPGDTPESMGVLSQMLAFDKIQAEMNGGHLPTTPPSMARCRLWLSQAVQRWSTEQRQSDKWTEETLIYAHAPTLKLFRELISSQQPPSDDQKPERWDMQLGDLDASAMDKFLVSFWSFPSRLNRPPFSGRHEAR